MKEVLKLDHIKKYYGNGGTITKAIEDISFSVQAGEFVGIMGASGSGKTTLLNCISTIDTVSAGHIYLDGTDVTEINEKEIPALPVHSFFPEISVCSLPCVHPSFARAHAPAIMFYFILNQ